LRPDGHHSGRTNFQSRRAAWHAKCTSKSQVNVFAPSPTAAAPPPVSRSPMSHWLRHLGALGLFAVAIFDSSLVPITLPGSTDLLLLWLVSHNRDPWVLVPSAVAGSILGGYTTWQLGRKGGEAALRSYVPKRMLGRVMRWVERHPVLAVFVPALLPPPVPLAPFVLAAGALGVSRNRFILAYGSARSLRYGLVAWLGVVYGHSVAHLWSGTLQKWTTPLLWIFIAMMVAGVAFGIHKVRRLRRAEAASKALKATAI
jgi:membrane protein YqaA with SNARE-associated domain